MLILDSNKSILISMLSSETTMNPDYIAAWADSYSTTFSQGSNSGHLSGMTNVVAIPSPTINFTRVIKTLTIYNNDSVANTIFIELLDSGTTYNIAVVTLDPGDYWTLDGTYDYLGELKVRGNKGFSGYSGYSGQNGSSGYSGYSGGNGDKFATSSNSTLTISTGLTYLTGGTGLAWTIGQSAIIVYDTSNLMIGEVMNYDPITGAFVVWVDLYLGSGSYSSWQINLDGAVGQQGSSGYSGYSGINGSNGVSGYSGINGSDGVSGYSGYSGSGISGYSGSDGTNGLSGYSGYSGSDGTDGQSGYSGYSGSNGTNGISGYSGSGISGYSGSNGSNGISGYSGYNGSDGVSGYSGYSGSNGTNGVSGYSGYSGNDGIGMDSSNSARWFYNSGVIAPNDPTNTYFASDNLTISSVGSISINTQNIDYILFYTWLHALGLLNNGNTIPILQIYEVGNTDILGIWQIIEIIDHGSYFDLSLQSPTVFNGSFTNNKEYTISWTILGTKGSSGYSGFSGQNPGASGYSGYSGISGYSGYSGSSGYSGPAGATISMLQSYNSSSIVTQTSLTDISFDSNDFSIGTDISHSPTGTTFTINTTGQYLIHYCLINDTSSLGLFAQVKLNNSTIINGSYIAVRTPTGSPLATNIQQSFITSLNASDYIRLQASASATSNWLSGDTYISIIRISGAKGDSGTSGYSGYSGKSGYSGYSGYSGTSVGLIEQLDCMLYVSASSNYILSDNSFYAYNVTAVTLRCDTGYISGVTLSGSSAMTGVANIVVTPTKTTYYPTANNLLNINDSMKFGIGTLTSATQLYSSIKTIRN